MRDRNKSQTCAPSVLGRFVGNQNGASAIEYALIAGSISIVIVGVVYGLGSEVLILFTSVLNSF